MTIKKVRLDVLLVEKGLIETREKAKRAIMAGLVFSGSNRLDKPGDKIAEDTLLTIKGKELPYVGRGGLKLEKAIKAFNLDLTDRIMVDVGSSTGGFTDCALQNGIKICYAVDVGYNQLAWKLRNDDRVIVMERTNFRYATPDLFKHGSPDVATIDVSFISLKLIFPALANIITDGADVIALIKPQFEAGRDQVEKKGIVKKTSTHLEVLTTILTFANQSHFILKHLTYSPVTGGDGNIEFLAHFVYRPNQEVPTIDYSKEIEETVLSAHEKLK
ncbi:TlyA family RNA methyltransferase [Amphibacillus sp. MSJ-3]|uniref:TlyA family RNA methyltransferase n=1 Tax=Amphibacillus sp. MSJ-3 TaxID=2841505 RepID=UPI001C0E93B8|nr:TlyA family RNA methyltransferase [Amphibacillus sp. MSJ-3]MBU5594808.1 TlyA family RNA methyltransferase [Amphibacillus sp. MSJ-3]